MPPEQGTPSFWERCNQVTWYSKLGAIILFLGVVPALSFYIGMQYQSMLEATNQPVDITVVLPMKRELPANSIIPETIASSSFMGFEFRGKPILPRCVNQLVGGSEIGYENKSTAVNLYTCGSNDEASSTTFLLNDDGQFFGRYEIPMLTMPGSYLGFDSYRVIGRYGELFVIESYWNGGGSGYPAYLAVVRIEEDQLQLIKLITTGEGCSSPTDVTVVGSIVSYKQTTIGGHHSCTAEKRFSYDLNTASEKMLSINEAIEIVNNLPEIKNRKLPEGISSLWCGDMGQEASSTSYQIFCSWLVESDGHRSTVGIYEVDKYTGEVR